MPHKKYHLSIWIGTVQNKYYRMHNKQKPYVNYLTAYNIKKHLFNSKTKRKRTKNLAKKNLNSKI